MRVICFDKADVDGVSKELADFGCATEYFKSYNLLAVSVPGARILASTESYLNKKLDMGLLDYEGAICRR